MFENWTIEWDKIPITKLGIDEHSFKGRNLIITITDLSNHKLLAILKADTQIELENFLENIPISAQKRLKEACMDLSSSYREAVRKCLPRVKITADRFHVESLGKRALDEIRQIVQVEEGKRKIRLKQLLLTNRENLGPKEIERLERVFKYYQSFPSLRESWVIKEKIRQIYWAKDKQEALKRYHHAIMLLETAHDSYFLKTLLKTLKEWKNEILNYFDNKTTNGFTEGCHTKIKMLKRVSFGFRNINNYIAKMTLAFLPLLWIINYHTF
jgi:transposase